MEKHFCVDFSFSIDDQIVNGSLLKKEEHELLKHITPIGFVFSSKKRYTSDLRIAIYPSQDLALNIHKILAERGVSHSIEKNEIEFMPTYGMDVSQFMLLLVREVGDLFCIKS